jgi:hypothetical protein
MALQAALSAAVKLADGRSCPPSGDNKKEDLISILKNRTDSSEWQTTPFATILGWQWPSSVVKRVDMSKWTTDERNAIAEYAGQPVAVEGYLLGAVKSGVEACNCGSSNKEDVDFHIWLYDKRLDHEPGDAAPERKDSIVVEMTARVRAHHPGWTVPRLKNVAKQRLPVRVSGWTFFDPEHPEQITGTSNHPKTRKTLWEVHPIMQLEVQQSGSWIELDDAQL